MFEKEELADLESTGNRVPFEEKLGKQSFHYDTKEFFERIIKIVKKTSEKLLEKSKTTTAAIENSTALAGTQNSFNNHFNLIEIEGK